MFRSRSRRGAVILAAAFAALLLVAIAVTVAVDPSTTSGGSLASDGDRKRRAAQITSTFENSTTELQYAYAENIGDGRGITAGRAGFTSGTSDLLLLVRRYTELKPDNPLAPYLPALEAVNGTDSEEGLAGFTDAWAQAAADPAHRQLQDDLVDELYFNPAMALARDVGLTTALGQAVMWDTMIQHGRGGENGTIAIIEETRAAMGGDVAGDEAGWLNAFLDARLHHLGDSYGDSPDADESSISRVEAFKALIAEGAFTLDPPLTWSAYGSTFTLTD
jgi:chitosanase